MWLGALENSRELEFDLFEEDDFIYVEIYWKEWDCTLVKRAENYDKALKWIYSLGLLAEFNPSK